MPEIWGTPTYGGGLLWPSHFKTLQSFCLQEVSSGRPIKTVMPVAAQSTGGNFEYVAIPRQGPLYISGALKQREGIPLRVLTIGNNQSYHLLEVAK
ncbi:MAG: hypothetical protein VX800_00405 [Chloroflexota bacterium]|nr:hypothetical protein [Chloroflexota bacterium]